MDGPGRFRADLPCVLGLASVISPRSDAVPVVADLVLPDQPYQRRQGGDTIVPAVLDVLLLYMLRAWLDDQLEHHPGTGWTAALNDPALTAVLHGIHHDAAVDCRCSGSPWWSVSGSEVVIRGHRDRLSVAMDLVGREVRREEVYGCCERHPMPPLVASGPNQNQDAPVVLPPHLRCNCQATQLWDACKAEATKLCLLQRLSAQASSRVPQSSMN